ncbi:MAG: TIGR03032 family protein [Actinomycetota bacterium]|nr:TIGR03032 family protein [Actinomycetota bacterium]
MTDPSAAERERLAAREDRAWRDPEQVISQWEDAATADPRLLESQAHGAWWDVLAHYALTVLVSREYEHLLIALSAPDGRPRATFMRLPHPSGVAFDAGRGIVHVAATRNPNQVFDLAPVSGALPRADAQAPDVDDRPLVPLSSRYLPGCTYLHDLALVDGELHGNAVGENAVLRLPRSGPPERVWWPHCVERDGTPDVSRNYLQLNSIAAGADIESSYFSASSERISARRPGHRNYPVDGRGVIFSGSTREPMARGLTRPHSARLHQDRVWVDNSGYGELGVAANGAFEAVMRLPGWTRGLSFAADVAFVGTSRVLPSFRQYAPGLEVEQSSCAVHAVRPTTGEVLGSLVWPYGNQVFAVEPVPAAFSLGFPFLAGGRRSRASAKRLFYTFQAHPQETGQ